jgi:hypothetical protein
LHEVSEVFLELVEGSEEAGAAWGMRIASGTFR